MGNRNNAIIAIIVCFVLFFVFAMLFFSGKTKRNKIIKPKDSSHENNMISFSKDNYNRNNNKLNIDSNGKTIKTAPQNIYENEKNLKEIKEHMEIVRRKVNRMKEMKENINEQ